MSALNKMKVKAGSDSDEIPALDPRRMTPMEILPYKLLPSRYNDAELLERHEILSLIEADLRAVLCLSHDLFWCQAIFDESLHRCIESYLQHAPRKFDKIHNELRPESKDKLSTVHRLVFMVCLRMSTHKESKENFIDPGVFGDILYENFLFDLPKILDICVLYGRDNIALVSKMVDNIFKQQPKYWDDLRLTAGNIEQIMETIMQECGIDQHPDNDAPRELTQKISNNKIETMSDTALGDIVAYLCDVAVTLCSFCEVFVPACEILYQCDFVSRLAFFYDVIIAEVRDAIKSRTQSPHTRTQLHTAKKHLISAFHQILQSVCLTPVLDHEPSAERDKKIDDYLHTLSQVIEYRRFIAAYETYHPFDDVMDILSQANCDIDMTRITYIQDAINHAFATYGHRKKPPGHPHAGGRGSPDGEAMAGEAAAGAGVLENGHDPSLEGACSVSYSGIELESMISLVRDLLPDFGDGFIELCLQEFGYDTEKVVNALLENNIPECLQDISRQLERRPDQQPTNETRLADEKPKDVLEDRRNVFDHDEFDVFNTDDIAFDRIHQGKKQLPDDILDNKEAIHTNRALYNFYGSNDVDSAYDRFDMYEDDYDDTYDDTAVAAGDADDADELNAKRNNVFGNERKDRGAAVAEETSSETDDEEKQKRSKNFCQDPALQRKRAEERRASKMGQRGGQGWKRQIQPDNQNSAQASGQAKGQGSAQASAQASGTTGQNSGQNTGPKGPVKYDVTGKPKGQGQDGNVLKNRAFKEQNKSRKANHNRRNLADKKRAKGMGAL